MQTTQAVQAEQKKTKSHKLVNIDDAKEVGKAPFDTPQAQEIIIPPSGLEPDPIFAAGKKCAHGVYIPANSPDPNRAEYCTNCYPYNILVKSGSIYSA